MEATLQSPFGRTVLEPGVVTIGYTPDNKLIVHDAEASYHHAVVRSTEQGYTITDLGSPNGTFVNEQRLDATIPRLLTVGDRIRIGETVFTYEVLGGAALVSGQGSSPGYEPAALAAPAEYTAYGAEAQIFSEPLAQTQYGSAPPQEDAPAPPRQPDVPPGAPGAIPAYGAAPPLPPYTPPPQQEKPPPKGGRRKMPKRWRIFALIALIILLVGGSAPFLISWLSSVLPGATATVAVTPASQHLTQTYAISAVTGTPDASQHQVQARQLSFATKAQSKTVKATGRGHQDVTAAKGKLTITPIQGTIPLGWDNLPSGSGVKIDFYVANPITSETTVDAVAEVAGSAGNIPAYDIDGQYSNNSGAIIYAQNPQAFTGGQDAHDYTYVQQSDIDDAAAPLVSQLTSEAQNAVQRQLRANEQFASTPVYIPTIKTNHKANDRVNDVTVTVTVTYKGEVYDQQAARSMASDLLKSDATSQLGNHYILVGDTVIVTPQVVTTDQSGVVTVNVRAEGNWVYQFSDTYKQQLAQLIAGKPLTDASALLLKQEGVWKVTLTTNGGWGSALPASPNDIKFNVLAVPGLQATP